MVQIYRALRSFLLADAAIAAAVGTRIYPVKLPQGALDPAISIFKVYGLRHDVLHGAPSLAQPEYQIDCWVRETSGVQGYTVVQELGSAVLARLDDAHDGTMMTDAATSPPTNYRVTVEFRRDREGFDPDVNGGYFKYSADFFIWHGVNPVAA